MKSGRQIIFPSILQNTYIHTDTNSLQRWPCPASLDKITQDPGYMTEILHSLFHCLEQPITSSPVRGNLRRPYNLQSPRKPEGNTNIFVISDPGKVECKYKYSHI